jgi:hypothetical protein
VQPPARRSLPDMSNHVFSRWTRPPSGLADVESEVVVGGESGRSGSAEHGCEGVVVVVYFDVDLARVVSHDPADVLLVLLNMPPQPCLMAHWRLPVRFEMM